MNLKSPNEQLILFLEDLEDDYLLMLHELQKSGMRYRSMRVTDGPAFIDAVNRFQPACILSAYLLPGYCGLEAFQDLKSMGKTIPFVLVAGDRQSELTKKCLDLGINGLLYKDNFSELPRVLRSAFHAPEGNRTKTS
jgi:CheY-like chemotaxis protein